MTNLKNSTNNNQSVYKPFARKYRPQDFSEILAQEVLVKTLSYAIDQNKLNQSYILSGIRGVGKTSTARIVARTINCTATKKVIVKNQSYELKDILVSCGECKNCEAFKKNNHPDILEIDAASNTGVDDVKRLMETAEYAPIIGAYKVFIIDEVHMLSRSAFNALLKIIEEPPRHVIFIFATTELNKIPPTIRSRCQKFNLKRFSHAEIMHLLEKIAAAENVEIDAHALSIIAVKSEGSARDALALLDQAVSYNSSIGTKSEINIDLLHDMLGITSEGDLMHLLKLIIASDAKAAIKYIGEIYKNCLNLLNFTNSIAEIIAELIKYKEVDGYNHPLLSHYKEDIELILCGMSLSKLSILWQIFSNGSKEIKDSHNELLTLEMLIFKAIYASSLPNIENILSAESTIHKGAELSNSKVGDDELEHKNSVNNTNNANSRSIKPSLKNIPTSKIEDNNPLVVNEDSAQISNVNDKKLWQFLKYLNNEKEFESYYFLLNEVEILQFNDENITLNYSSISSDFDHDKLKNKVAKIKAFASDFMKRDINIKLNDSQNIFSLKQKIIEKVKQEEDFNIIKNNYPGASISDIILAK